MNKITLALTAALAAMSAPAFAQVQSQPQPQAADGGHGGWKQDMTRSQAQQRADKMFQRFDVNHDGTVTRAEAQQAASQMPNGGDRAQRMIDRMFGQAQTLTQAQFEAQSLARFDAQDLNHDGTVTAAERQQARAQAHPERG
jgi:Ca2+-binding EF-hand superfamily protein